MLRRNILTLATALIVMLALGACRHGEPKGEKVDTDSIVVDTTATLGDAPNAPRCNVHVVFHYAKGENAQTINDSLLRSGILTPDYLAMEEGHLDPRNAVRTFARRYVEDYQRDGQLILGQEPDYAELNWTYAAETKVERYRKGTIAYIATVTAYEGGSQPTTVTIVRNIDTTTGRILGLADVLLPGADKTLLDEVVKELCKRNDVNELAELQQKGCFVGIEPYLPDNFIAADDDIVFIYQPGEIAATEMGEIRVTVENIK